MKGKNSSTLLNTLEKRLEHIVGGGSVRAFADFIGVSKSTIHNFLNGTKPSWDFLLKLAEKGVNINWLLTGEGKPYMSDYVEKRDAFLSKKKTSKHSKQE